MPRNLMLEGERQHARRGEGSKEVEILTKQLLADSFIVDNGPDLSSNQFDFWLGKGSSVASKNLINRPNFLFRSW